MENILTKKRIKIFLFIIIMLCSVFYAKIVYAADHTIGYSIDNIKFEIYDDFYLDNILITYQDNNETDNNNEDDDNIDNDNNGININNIEEDDSYPVWNLVGQKYYETPFRRFEIIFFASFSYVLFLNITIIETISTIVPYFGGRIDFSAGTNSTVETFGLPLLFYTFVSSVMFALSIAAEDYRFVYIENININKDDENINNKKNNTNNNDINIYFAPGILLKNNSIDFRLLLIHF